MMTRLPVALIAGPVGVLHAASEIPRRRPNKEIMREPLVRVICRAMPTKFVCHALSRIYALIVRIQPYSAILAINTMLAELSSIRGRCHRPAIHCLWRSVAGGRWSWSLVQLNGTRERDPAAR